MNDGTRYFMGVDIGTTSVKVAAFESNGHCLYQESIGYGLFHPKPGYSEQDPDEIVKATINCINNVYRKLQPATPRLVSFSAAMHSMLAVNEQGIPITACIIWADNRANDIIDQFKSTRLANEFYKISGVPVHAMSPFAKLLWFKEHEPSIFSNAKKFIGIKEYVFHHLFGEYVLDEAIATATGLMTLDKRCWDKTIISFLELKEEQLSKIVSTNTVFSGDTKRSKIGAQLLLNADTPFIIGSSDGACANFSAGKVNPGTMVITVGTSSAVRVLSNKPMIDSMMRTFCYCASDEYYICGGGGNSGAIVLKWLKETVLESGDDMETFLNEAISIEPGSDGLLFLPYILGERAPIWDAHAKGVYFGLSVRHTKAHFIRASLEAVIFGIYSIAKVLMEKKEISKIYATGGFTRNKLWIQILADVFNKTITCSTSEESSAWGAVILGMNALDIQPTFDHENSFSFEPNPEHHLVYQKQFGQFERLYDLLKDEFANKETVKHHNSTTLVK